MSDEIPIIVISEVHEKCSNEIDGKPCGTITKWNEMFKCKACGRSFNKPDTAFYAFAILNVLETNNRVIVSSPLSYRDKLESVISYFKNIGILQEIRRNNGTVEQEDKENKRKFKVKTIEVELKKLGLLEAHK